MNRKEEWKDLHYRSNTLNYIKGDLESKKYSEEELEAKRKYFESQEPDPRFGVSKKRWLYEIKRHFEQKKRF